MTTDLDLLDQAVDLVREIGHRHGMSANGHKHLEFPLGHLREAWIDRDGQNARTPGEVHQAIASWYELAEVTAKRHGWAS